jgi:hypothetical protein
LRLNRNIAYKIIIALFVLIVPWFIFGVGSDVQPEKITSDLSFYEINTCSISLVEFLAENPNVIYQDHYKIRFNDYSAMRCFGTLTGVDQIDHVFYVSIGTSAYLNLILQSLFWCLVLSLLKKTRDIDLSISLLLSSIFSSLLITLMIYSEERFYVKNIYFHDFNNLTYFIQLFLTILFISIICYYLLFTRIDNLANFIPFLYLVIGVYSGLNFNFFSIGIIVFGINKFIMQRRLGFNFYYALLLLFIWSNNAYNKEFFVDPDKIRGLTSSIFTTQNVLVSGLFYILLINGLVSIFAMQSNFNIISYFRNSLYTSALILFVGLLSASTPLISFLSYYFFGLNKYGISRSNIFELNEWGERLAWRGHYPSAETIGEFFAIIIFLYIFLLTQKKIAFSYVDFIFVIFALIGLMLSNNRAALLSIVICTFILIAREKRDTKYVKYSLITVLISITALLIGFNNLKYSLTFLADSVLSDAIYYSINDTYSSSTEYFISEMSSGSFVYSLVSLLSVFGFYVNRSELWGIFFARHNPELQEVLFGSGLYNFGQLYGDVKVNSTYSFLLPHSSLLSLYLFIGTVNLLILMYFFVTRIIFKVQYSNNVFLYLSIFVMLNLLKSDSILYFSALVNYFFYFYSAYKLKKSYI